MRARGMAGGIAALLLAQPTLAASLCRDSKGLFTPCPRAANSTARAILTNAPARTTSTPAPRDTASVAPTRETVLPRESVATRDPESPTVHNSSAASIIAQRQLLMAGTRKTRLCTDSKGLFTPCPR